MNMIRFDSVGGASGDMILAALIDLGVDADALRGPLASLPVEAFTLDTEVCDIQGTRGHRVHVRIPHEPHHHRHLADIQTLITDSALPDPVKTLSLAVFQNLAAAEAEAHHTTPDKIHFHEVGAIDSIVDTVGCCLALHLLKADGVVVGPLPLGTGTVDCAHGTLPVPVPATLALLRELTVVQTDEPFELVTPTGAALLATWQQTCPAPAGPGRPRRSGIGFGSRTLKGRLNMLRATLLDLEAPPAAFEPCLVLETNLDDMTPELIGSLTETLLTRGALDVFTTSVQMKKQRPGVLLTVLCHPQDKPRLLDTLFAESTTFGVRESETRRTVLDRRTAPVDTRYGPVTVKTGLWHGQETTRAPEHADCVRIAKAANVPIRAVYEAAMQASAPRDQATVNS